VAQRQRTLIILGGTIGAAVGGLQAASVVVTGLG